MKTLVPTCLLTIASATAITLACSGGSSSPPPSRDAGTDAPNADATGPADAGGPPTVTGLLIATASGAPLQAAAGDALPLKVVLVMSDGTTQGISPDAGITWSATATVVAQDPNNAGPGILPGPLPTPIGVFVQNPFRPERTDYTGTLFVIQAGTGSYGTLLVTAQVPDAGQATAEVPVTPTPPGDPDAGANLFLNVLQCNGCHGDHGEGSPPNIEADGSVDYILQGYPYPYPAPPLNNTTPDGGSPNLAADPGWNAGLLGFAAQADMDNMGVALRKPMPDWLGKMGAGGAPLSAQDFAHIYAFLKTQTQTQ